VIIFDPVRFLSKKIIKTGFFIKKQKPNQNWFKPIGFGSVILRKNQFKSVWLGFFQFEL